MSIFQDKKLVLHISLEIIILGSMTYFFHTKSKSLELRVKSIEEQFSKEISILQDSIIQLKKQLKKSDMAIEEIKNVQHSQNQFAPKLKNEPRQVEPRQVDTKRVEQRQAEARQVDTMRAEQRQAETRQAEAMRVEQRQAEAMRTEQRQAEAMRVEQRQLETRQVEQRQVEPNKDQFEDIVFTTFSIQQVPVYKQHATVELIEIDDKEYNKLTDVSTDEEHVNDKDDKHVNDEHVNDEHVNDEHVNDEHVNDEHVNDENEEKGNELDKELENELKELEN
jgi:hypothetical protein